MIPLQNSEFIDPAIIHNIYTLLPACCGGFVNYFFVVTPTCTAARLLLAVVAVCVWGGVEMWRYPILLCHRL